MEKQGFTYCSRPKFKTIPAKHAAIRSLLIPIIISLFPFHISSNKSLFQLSNLWQGKQRTERRENNRI
jgi:hypothetical protein